MTNTPKRLRILMVISQYWPFVGGAERQVERLSRELMRRGHHVEVLTQPHPSRPRRETREGVIIHRDLRACRLGKLWGVTYMLSAFVQLWKRRKEFDVFHLHQLYLHATSAALVRRLGGPPVIVKVVSSGALADWVLLHRMAGGAFWTRWAKRCDRVIAICRSLKPEMLAEGFDAGQIVRISNGVDDTEFRPDAEVIPEPGRILFLGRLDPCKGLLDLLQAMVILREGHRDAEGRPIQAHLHIVGEGEMREPVRKEIEALGLADMVVLRSFQEDVRSEYLRASVVVLPSTIEAMSNVILEAMAFGRPIVATRVGGAPDMLAGPDEESLPAPSADGCRICRAGILVEPRQPAALAAALARALSDATLARSLGENARTTIEEEFSIRAVAARYESLYEELVAEDK